jgi:surface antigen
MKINIRGIFIFFAAIAKRVKNAALFLAKIKNKVKLNIVYFLKPWEIKKLRSCYQSLLSKQNKNLIHIAVIVLATAIAWFNIFGSDEAVVSAKENSILVNLLFPEDSKYEIVKSDMGSVKRTEKSYLSMVSVASAAFIPGAMTNNQGALSAGEFIDETEDENLNVLGGNTLVKNNPTKTQESVKSRENVIKYSVLGGDTIFNIADKFGIDAATILQENNLYADDIIKPGMELSILPVSGTTERVDAGETLEGIASKHEADIEEIKKFNKLVLGSDIEEGQILIIPQGKREIKERPEEPQDTLIASGTTRANYAAASSRSARRSTSTATTYARRGGAVNGFPWGYCTWYAASKRGDVTWRGNAGTWLRNAQAQGRPTGRVPAKGAIIVTNESWWGHVGVVESVQGDKVTISEMNYAGYGKVSTRTISNKSGVIKGYVY